MEKPKQKPIFLYEAARQAAAKEYDLIMDKLKNQYAGYEWWLSDDPYVLFFFQLKESVLLIPFDRLKESIAIVLGRDIAAYELLKPSNLLNEAENILQYRGNAHERKNQIL